MFFKKEKKGFYANHLDEYILHVKSGEYSYLPYVFCVFSEKHKLSQLDAAKFICTELKQSTFDEIIKTDIQMREKTSMEWFVDWAKIEPEDFLLPIMSDDEKKAVLIFASFHPNGYLREKAIKLLAEYPQSLPYILLRMNDWVDQVREAAQRAFAYRLINLSEGELLTSLPFAEKLSRSSRAFHKPIIEKLHQTLLHPQNKKELELGLLSDNQYTRTLCMTAILNTEHPNIELILQYLQKEMIPYIRWIIYRNLLACEGIDLSEVMERMLTDKCAKIKKYALQFMYERGWESTYHIAIHFLADDNASVRGTARWVILKHDASYDFRSFYRNILGNKNYVSICGLGETGTEDDVEILQPFLGHDNERIIRAAMRSLMALNPDRFRVQMVKMLDNCRNGIVKEAFMQLSTFGFYNHEDEIHMLLQRSSSAYSRKKCTILLFRCSKWEAIIYMLEAILDSDEEIREYALVKISTWVRGFNRSFTAPSGRQQQRIKELITVNAEHLGDKISEELLFLVR